MKMDSSTELTACTWWVILPSASANSMAPHSATWALNLLYTCTQFAVHSRAHTRRELKITSLNYIPHTQLSGYPVRSHLMLSCISNKHTLEQIDKLKAACMCSCKIHVKEGRLRLPLTSQTWVCRSPQRPNLAGRKL